MPMKKFSDLSQFGGSVIKGRIKRRILGCGKEAKSMIFMKGKKDVYTQDKIDSFALC